jgi:streptogrisin C
MLSAMQRDLQLTAGQALARLAAEHSAGCVRDAAKARLGESFAGAWFTAGSEKLHVAITDAARSVTVRALGAEPVLVQRSARQLTATRQKLDRAAAAAPKSVTSWYVDVPSNQLVVTGRSAADAATFAATAGAEPAAVRVSTSQVTNRPLHDIRGGDPIGIGGGRCSIGFALTQIGFLTAGHCGRGANEVAGYNKAPLGHVESYMYPGHDYAIISSDYGWNTTGLVNDYASGTVAVTGTNEAPIGASVCKSGSRSGWSCGTISNVDVTVQYTWADGQGFDTVYGLTDSTTCSGPGDSGGAVLSGGDAQGLVSGGPNVGCRTYYQPLSWIMRNDRRVQPLTATFADTTRGMQSAASGRCVDVKNDNWADGTPAQLWNCSSQQNQGVSPWGGDLRIWTTHCLDAKDKRLAAGVRLVIRDCDGSPSQRFLLDDDGGFYNPQSGLYVDAHGTGNGDPVILNYKNGSANQKWWLITR